MRFDRAFLCFFVVLFGFMGCAEEPRERLSEDEIWGGVESEVPDGPFIDYRERSQGISYGLPRAGQPGIADLIALFPPEAAGFDDPDIFSADGLFSGPGGENCRGGSPEIAAELPLEIEAVVTVYPRQYMKVTVCGQDERHYGSFTIEDDTGGIVVLRDSRVTPWSYGDRIKLNVRALMLTFGRDLDTRAILLSDIEKAAQLVETDGLAKPILFERQVEMFTADDASRVKRIDGYVHVQPTNDNFNSLVMTSEPIPIGISDQDFEGETLQCVRTCETSCRTSRCDSVAVCGDACADACLEQGGSSISVDTLPVCWMVGVDIELGRRGFAPKEGERLQLTGPIVNNYDRTMWILDLGQVKYLD
jgi:hypothetical protein